MIMYFFGSHHCEKCNELADKIEKMDILPPRHMKIKHIDAFASNTQKFCDDHEVFEVPFVKIFDNNNRLIFSKKGTFDPIILWETFYPNEEERKIAMAKAAMLKRSAMKR